MRTLDSTSAAGSAPPVGFVWLTGVRSATILAGLGAVAAGRSALGIDLPEVPLAMTFAVWCISNIWWTWLVRENAATVRLAGSLALADTAVLTALMYVSGGILNPASVFYLVQIVMAALVLGRRWTWIVTAAAAVGYASLYLAPSEDLRAALGMHREFGLHMRGMWLAFAVTGLIVAFLVTQLAMAVERSNQALAELTEKTARATRAAGLATLAAGAAHELGSPLSTIAVAARELERRLEGARGEPDLLEDARLIRAETDRCRKVLDAMAGESGQSMGESPRTTTLGDVFTALRDRLGPSERGRVEVGAPLDLQVLWPIQVVSRALFNIVENSLQASADTDRVSVQGELRDDGFVSIRVTDRGAGMSAADLVRAGEPFFTTKGTGKGTGLGLFVARSTVEQLGGRLTMTSDEGRGTTTVIVLPANVVTPGATSRE